MLGRLPHDTAGLVELDLHVLIQVLLESPRNYCHLTGASSYSLK